MSAHDGAYLDDQAARAADHIDDTHCDLCGDLHPLDNLNDTFHCATCARKIAAGATWSHALRRPELAVDDEWAASGVEGRRPHGTRTTERTRTRDGATYITPGA